MVNHAIDLPTKREFAKLLAAGHGRAARVTLSKAGQRYRDQIVSACFEDRRYCVDTCADMGPYLARLLIHLDVDIVKDLELFIKGEALRVHRAFACSVLAALARRRVNHSEAALGRCVRHTLRRKEIFAAQEWIQLHKRLGIEQVFSIVESMRGDLAWFDYAYTTARWTLNLRSERVFVKNYPRIVEAATRKEPERPSFDSFEAFFEYANSTKPKVFAYSAFARNAKSSEARKAEAALATTKNLKVLEGLLYMFWWRKFDYRGSIDVLVSLCKHRSRRIRWRALRVARRITHPKIRALAEACLKSGRDMRFAIDLFETNRKRGDIKMLWDIAARNPKELPAHDFIMYLTSEEIVNKREPIEPLKWAYVASPCSACREIVVRRLAEKGELPKEWKRELLLDSELDCREYSRKL